MLDSTYTGIAFFVPNGDVPPTRNPECRFATSGLHGSMRFAPDLPREILRRYGAVAVHQHDQRLRVLVFHDERLDHAMFVDAELARRLLGAAMLDILVRMLAELDLVAPQELRRRRFGHVFCLGHVRHCSGADPRSPSAERSIARGAASVARSFAGVE